MTRRDMLLLSAAAAAADPPAATAADPTPDEAIHKYLAAEVERLSANVLDGAKTKDEWTAKRPALRRRFLDMLGLDPLPAKTDLKAAATGTLVRGDVTIEKVHFQSVPGLYVTGNLYRPKATDKKLPAILYVCGHSNRGRDGNKAAYQDHGMWFAANGYVCLVIDTLQLGEVAGKHHGTYNLDRFWWQSRGYTPAGVECWNGIRAIDYLCARPDVDAEKIGVTGISGGGATTVWVAAADDRVKVAVPVSGMSDLQSYVTNRVINGHCDCMFAYNTYRWEWTTILALFAPKPLLFANSDADPIFPMDGNRRIVARLRTCYDLFGAKDALGEYVSPGGHAYRPDLRVAVFDFFNRHLKERPVKATDQLFDVIPGADLRVFPADADLPKDAINATADETFVPKAVVKLPAEAKDFPAWKAGLVKQLRERSFRALPEKVPGYAAAGDWLGVDGIDIVTEPGVRCRLSPAGPQWFDKGGTALVVLNPDEEAKAGAAYWVKRYPGGVLPLAVHTRGGGPYRWTRKSPPNTVERSLALLGQTADSGRVRDVAMALASDPDVKQKTKVLRLVGRGPAGIIAAYAALFVPGVVDEVVILDPPASHRDGPHFLNVMRALDIPDALGLLAPAVALTLIGAKDPAFDKTAAIYKLAGAEAKFKRE